MDMTRILAQWNAGPIEDGSVDKLKTREIGGKLFQFRLADVRTRTRMGMAVLRQGGSLAEMAVIGAQADDGGPKEVNIGIGMISALCDERIADLVESMMKHAQIWNGDRFEPLDKPNVFEAAFTDNLTLQIPVAITVAEVNLPDFLEQIGEAFTSPMSATQG